MTDEVQPIPMILHCPKCGLQHVDKSEGWWTNPPHKSHLCLRCAHIWRPADVPTEGVESIQTAGKADSVKPDSITLPRETVQAVLDALEYHQEQTRPIYQTKLTIAVLEAVLSKKEKT